MKPTDQDMSRDVERDRQELDSRQAGGGNLWYMADAYLRRALYAEELARVYAENLFAIEEVCLMAGVGSRGQPYVCRVKDLAGRLRDQIARAERAEAEAERLQAIIDGLAARVAAQSELLTRKAGG